MKKFMYITDINDGEMLINTDFIVYLERDTFSIKMQDGTTFVVSSYEFDEILTELERRR